jgi:hypothetical protein
VVILPVFPGQREQPEESLILSALKLLVAQTAGFEDDVPMVEVSNASNADANAPLIDTGSLLFVLPAALFLRVSSDHV